MSHLEKIFNALVLYCYNMRALHWKIKGLSFDTKHELADNYHEKLAGFVDDIAEILMMLGNAPKDLRTVVGNIGSDENEGYLLISCEGNTYYTEEQMLRSINQMFNHLIALYESACNDGNLPGDVVSKLQEHEYFFRLESRYKGKNRLMSEPTEE